ncbi:MAG: cupin domain-containing protein [Thermodesulfobacteriota bacterium]
MNPENPFFTVEGLPSDFIRPGTERRSIQLGEALFMFISFDRPTVSPLHDHTWDSIIYIDRGEFEVTVGDQRRRLSPGEGTVIPAGVQHTLTTDAGSRIIELWHPVKQA